MNKFLLQLITFLPLVSIGQETNTTRVEINDSIITINSQTISNTAIMLDVTKILGSPNRIKHKNFLNPWNFYIYDDLGILLTEDKNYYSISFVYERYYLFQPKSKFRGIIKINGHYFDENSSFDEIQKDLLPLILTKENNRYLSNRFFSFAKALGKKLTHISFIKPLP